MVKIVNASDGLELQYSFVDYSTLVNDLISLLEIPIQCQIILTTAGTSPNVLAASDTIFIYDKRLLVSCSISPEFTPPVSLILPRELENTSNSIQFLNSMTNFALSLFDSASVYYKQCSLCCNQQINQSLALQAAILNLASHSNSLLTAFDLFYPTCQQYLMRHSALLWSFDFDVYTLSQIPAQAEHAQADRGTSEAGANNLTAQADRGTREAGANLSPEHAQADRGTREAGANTTTQSPESPQSTQSTQSTQSKPKQKFLSDYIPIQRLTEWAIECQHLHQSLQDTAAEFTLELKNIKSSTLLQQNTPLDIDINISSQLVTKVHDSLKLIHSRQLILERDFNKVSSLLNQSKNKPLDSEKSIAIQHLIHIHKTEYLPELIELEKTIIDSLETITANKISISNQLTSRLVSISKIQSMVAAATPKLGQLHETLIRENKAFGQLLHFHRIAPSWGAALIEIIRRKEFSKLFIQKAKEAAELFQIFRLMEEKRRINFKNEIFGYVPVGLINGLDGVPPLAEITLSHTQDQLPNITRADIAELEMIISRIRVDSPAKSPGLSGQSDSAAKLQATIVKMASHVSSVYTDFEKACIRSNFFPKENPGLRRDDSNIKFTESTFTIQEQNKAYEERIKSLENILQASYSKTDSERIKIKSVTEIENLLKKIHQQEERIAQDALKIENLTTQNSQLSTSLEIKTLSLKNNQMESENIISEITKLKNRITELESDSSRIQDEYDAFKLQSQSSMEKVNTFYKDLKSKLHEFKTVTQECIDEPQSEIMNHLENLKIEFLSRENEIAKVYELETMLKNKQHELFILSQPSLKISFQNFKIGDLVLFLPTRNPIAWTAFNVSFPHYFLSPESHHLFPNQIKKRDWILGIISDLQEVHANEENMFGLSSECVYHICNIFAYSEEGKAKD